MAEILSPNPTKPKVTRIQSPPSPFFLGSNDDQLERAQARAARAAAIRRKYLASNAPQPPHTPSVGCLNKEQISELFRNCIKLASENKINQKNMWDLKLIDHLSEIIKVETENNDSETNFQKASCTLEAGVKIYSLRVDSVHVEAYKVLGRIIRAGGEDERGNPDEARITVDGSDEGGCTKEKQKERKISPLSTLESSFDTLNVKKFDVAFTVDPLYHQTSAQFDEGGAKGLLLNNLGVYGGCKMLFDSLEAPSKCMWHSTQDFSMDTIDLSFARECVEQMLRDVHEEHEISPTLRKILQFHENNQKLPHNLGAPLMFGGSTFSIGESDLDLDSNIFQNFEAEHNDNEGGVGVDNESFTFGNEAFADDHEGDNPCTSFESDVDRISEEIAAFLFQGSGFTKQNAWAGPEHWKYRNRKESLIKSENKSNLTSRKLPKDGPPEPNVDFMSSVDENIVNLFAAPKRAKLLLLAANRLPPERKLPEDCHYQPENLVRLFLLPNVLCFGKEKRKSSGDNLSEPIISQEQDPSWDNGSDIGGNFDDACSHDEDDTSRLVSHPRQVNKIDVDYDKTSKQVDVHILKETLWDHIQESTQAAERVYEGTISFKDVLATFPNDCKAAPTKDISPHLCFICLLHLANEHNLSIYECQTLDDFKIQLPSPCRNQTT